jgi:hypothetical protein
MDVRRRWRRVDAEHWVHVWGMVVTAALALATMWALVGGWLAGVPFVAVLPAALASLAGWLTSAWRRERPWAWWVWTTGAAAAAVTALNTLIAGRPVAVAALIATGILLLLLFHPDSRARIETSPSVVR